MFRSTGLLILFSLLGQAIGLAVQVVLAHRFGTGVEVDAYVVALTLPGLVEAFVLAGVAQLLLPLLVRRFEKGDGDEAWRVLSTLLTVLCGGLLALSLPVALAREEIATLLAPGLDPEATRLAGGYLAGLFPGLGLGVAAALLTQAFHARRRFVLPAIVGAAAQVIPLGAVLLFSGPLGLWSLIAGSVIAKAAVLVPLAWFLLRRGATLRPRAELRHPEIRRLAWLALPVLAAVASARMNGAVDRLFVSFLGDGKLAALGYADRLVGLVLAVLVAPVTAVLYPALAACESRGNRRDLFRVLDRGMRIVIAGMIPFTVALCVLATPAMRLLFEGGRFSDADTSRVAGILISYGGILVLGGVGSLLIRGFYAIGNVRDPMIWGGFVPLAANVIFDALVFRRWDVYGVAAVTSANALLGLPILYVILKKRMGAETVGGWTSFLLRAGLSGAFMVWVMRLLSARLPASAGALGAIVPLLLLGATGLASYACAAWLLRLEPVTETLARVRGALRVRGVGLLETLR